jgi:hypothetical protein
MEGGALLYVSLANPISVSLLADLFLGDSAFGRRFAWKTL